MIAVLPSFSAGIQNLSISLLGFKERKVWLSAMDTDSMLKVPDYAPAEEKRVRLDRVLLSGLLF